VVKPVINAEPEPVEEKAEPDEDVVVRGWAKVFTTKPGDVDAPEPPHLPVQRNSGEIETAPDPAPTDTDEEQRRGE
jgi:hypothetical protein